MLMKEEFYALAYHINKKLYEEQENIAEKAVDKIEKQNQIMEKKIEQDIKNLEKVMIHNELFDLNMYESERISDVNRSVANSKNECIEDFKSLLRKRILIQIEKTPEIYYKFLINKIIQYLLSFEQDVHIHLNKRDLNYFKTNRSIFFKFLKKNNPQHLENLTIHFNEKPINTIAGFLLVPNDNSYEIEFTFESQIELLHEELIIRFMKIFPIFEIQIKYSNLIR